MRAAPAAFAALLLGAPPAAPGLSAREIMQRVSERDDGDFEEATLEMRLLHPGGRERVRRLTSLRREDDGTTLSLLFFESPAHVRDTGFLTYDYDDADRDDDQWLYLPALHKARRIAGADQSGSFMGSDFSFADLGSLKPERYEYRLLGETAVGDHPVWQIEARPATREEVKRTGYSRSTLFVRQDNFVPVRAVHWLERGGRLKYMEVKRLERIDGIWVITEAHMTTKKGARTLHRTVITMRDVRLDRELDRDLFTLRRLEKGR